MRGPDFDVGRVTEWRVGPDGTARLVLGDGSSWSVATSSPIFAGIRATVELAQQLGAPVFVSGDRRTGQLDGADLPERLMPAHVDKEPVDGKLAVVFHGPPTPAFLRVDRPWFAAARERLAATAALETPNSFPPALLVTIDVVTREILDVRVP